MPYFRSYAGLDRYLLNRVPPTQPEVVFTFAEVAALLALPEPLSAVLLETRLTRTEARRHWLRVGFAVRINWIARQVVFTRLVAIGR